MSTGIITSQGIERAIRNLRGHRVLLDTDPATLYGVETKALNRAVKRNLDRFPDDFMFQLTGDETAGLRTAPPAGRGGRRYQPFAFTEHGVVMLSSVLSSPRAVIVNIQVVRVFVRLRELVTANAQMAKHLETIQAELRRQAAELGQHKTETNQALRVVFQMLRQLEGRPGDPPNPADPIGFATR